MYKNGILGAIFISAFALAACDSSGVCISGSSCSDGVAEEDCDAIFLEGEACNALPTGACPDSSSCLSVVEQQCLAGTFHLGKSCEDVAKSGACVDDGCNDTTNFSCPFGTFTEGKTCDEVDPKGACFDTFGSTSCDENKRQSECDGSTEVHCAGETCATCDENG